MAGDIGIDEQVMVLSPQVRKMAADVAESAQQEGAHVIHEYGPRVMIGEVPEHRADRVPAATAGATLTAPPYQLPPGATEDLDPIGALGLAAFSLRQSAEYIAAKERRPYKDAEWDAGGPLLPPDPPPQHRRLIQSPESAAGTAALTMEIPASG